MHMTQVHCVEQSNLQYNHTGQKSILHYIFSSNLKWILPSVSFLYFIVINHFVNWIAEGQSEWISFYKDWQYSRSTKHFCIFSSDEDGSSGVNINNKSGKPPPSSQILVQHIRIYFLNIHRKCISCIIMCNQLLRIGCKVFSFHVLSLDSISSEFLFKNFKLFFSKYLIIYHQVMMIYVLSLKERPVSSYPLDT